MQMLPKLQEWEMNMQKSSDSAMCTVKVPNVHGPRRAMWFSAWGQDAQRAQPMCAIELPIAQSQQTIFFFKVMFGKNMILKMLMCTCKAIIWP